MTRREAAIVSAYTGYLIGKFEDLHGYVEEILGRPVFTHEFPALEQKIQQHAKKDFVAITVTDGAA